MSSESLSCVRCGHVRSEHVEGMCESCARDEIERGSSSAVFHFFTLDPPSRADIIEDLDSLLPWGDEEEDH